jgi:hypothetical protein
MADFNQDDSVTGTPMIKTIKVVYPQIYSYTLPDLPKNEGSQKIGYTERQDVDTRIYEQTHTAAFQLNSEKLWSAPAFIKSEQKDFKDKDFHRFLVKSDVENRADLGTEWFYFNGTPEKSKQLFDTFREKGFAALQYDNQKVPYTLRSEQSMAVEQAKNYYDNHEKGEFLWNAKPRFGKTLASYDLAKRLGATKVLIVTNRPAIANSWFGDFDMFIDGFYFISETSSLVNRPTLTREQYISTGSDKPQITFLSLQDLKGSKYFGGSHDKLRWIADLEWDLLIIDEAHEGIDTDRTDAAFDIIKRKHTLHLSGTPFKALANNKFSTEAIFNWTYLDEQKIKQAEQEEGEIGDHTDLPNLKLYTYRISQMIADEVNEGIEIDDQTHDFAFDLNEFFATKNQIFVHEDDVKEFLKNLTTNAKYPFSTPELRDQLKHTFWYVGNRVDSVKALEQLLSKDDVFKEYKVVVAAGDGKSFEEEETDFKGNEKSFDKVKKAIEDYDKTITLSCGQLTTGVTIKEWNAVLMLTDIKTPAQYMQAAFRAQNPHRFREDGELKAKESAYLFDFAPTRVLEIYDQFANGLNGKAANGEITQAERKQNIKELLNFFPVISEDIDGQMVELDAEMVLTFPNALAAAEIVKARFMTNLLFNENIKGVFQFPKEVEDILEKMPIEKNKRVEVAKKELDLDDARKVEELKQTKINENTGVILGEKIYRANIDRVVDNALSYETPEESIETIPEQVFAIAELQVAKIKEIYKLSNTESEEVKREIDEKIKLVAAEFENGIINGADEFKEKLYSVIELDLVQAKVEQNETAVVENVQKTKEDEVRDRLRSFTRTIPMFIMANSSKETITIDNFDLEITDKDFVDLTNITKAEFHKLRDGFDYDVDGERNTFGGVFDRYKFNASIAEFAAEKQKRSNYFKTEQDIFELIPNQKNNQIFTPKRVVQMMVDSLEEEQPELFRQTDSTFIDPYMKSGMYITEIVEKLFINTRQHYSSDAECINHILENQVYGLAPTKVLHDITQSFIFGFDKSLAIGRHNFAQHDLLPEARDGTAHRKLNQIFKNGGTMNKFDAVVGNPPYQEAIVNRGEQPPIYHLFMDSSYKISDIAILITPARFLSNAGATPASWNYKMLNDNHLKVIYYEQKSSNVFPNTYIEGGVAVTLRNAKKNYGPIGTFATFTELNSILHKVTSSKFDNLGNILHSNTSYKYSQLLLSEHREFDGRLSGGSRRYAASSVFDVLPEIFYNNKPNDGKDYIRILGRQNNERVYMYVERKYFAKHVNLDKYKVFVPSSNGASGKLNTDSAARIISKPLVGEPGIGATETFISFGAFDNKEQAEYLLKYIKTKFARVMLGVLKVTQGNKNKRVWSKVPLFNFDNSDFIDWSKPISEIDQQLYKKHDFSKEEIDFIESHIAEMA